MPNIPTHLNLARKIASRLSYPKIDRNLGCFLLGSTSPDIRSITKSKRDETHFAPLNIDRIGTGVEGLFQKHPALRDPTLLTDETQVFLAGYFCHLIADETWIVDIYQPYFNGGSPSGDQVQLDIWDRAVQMDMDKVSKNELGDPSQICSELNGSGTDVHVEFISGETLDQWKEWVAEFISREFSWDRLRFMTNRMYRDDADAMRKADDFLGNVTESLRSVYKEIPTEKVAAFQEKVVDESVGLIKEYLGELAGN